MTPFNQQNNTRGQETLSKNTAQGREAEDSQLQCAFLRMQQAVLDGMRGLEAFVRTLDGLDEDAFEKKLLTTTDHDIQDIFRCAVHHANVETIKRFLKHPDLDLRQLKSELNTDQHDFLRSLDILKGQPMMDRDPGPLLVVLVKKAIRSADIDLWILVLSRITTQYCGGDILDVISDDTLRAEIKMMREIIERVRDQLSTRAQLSAQDTLQTFNILLPIFKIRKKAEGQRHRQKVKDIQGMVCSKQEALDNTLIVRYLLAPELYEEAAIDLDKGYDHESFEQIRTKYLDEDGKEILSAIETGKVGCDHVIGLFEQLNNEACAIYQLYFHLKGDAADLSEEEASTARPAPAL